jgi:AraC family transcriptional regulator
MEVKWSVAENQSPYIFRRQAAWQGFDLRHYRVLPGELTEQSYETHEINLTLAGTIESSKQTATGELQCTRRRAGSLCIVPPGQTVRAVWKDELECLSINLNAAFFAQTTLEFNLPPDFELKPVCETADPLMQHIGLALINAADSPETTEKIYAESLAQTLLLHLFKNYGAPLPGRRNMNGGLAGYRLRRVNEFITAHLEDDLSLSEIAAVAGLSPFHFARAFRRTVGLTPQQFVTQKRLERAKELLKNRDLPLVEVSLQAGFKNQSHFTTLFRKFTALTPKAWREAKLNFAAV